MIYVYSLACLIGGLFIVNAAFAYQNNHIDPDFWSILKFQIAGIPIFMTANMLIIYGIKFGYRAFNSLTFVLSASKGLELFISVAVGFLFMKETPGWRTWTGLAVVLAGVVLSKSKG
ncbi:hypothetical protein [Paenibacillus sp. NEAU-GSW1]|uniref:hypothetical protein n=1 Tax=Paenibacillus sp. NEAU-GSW1 TaxID=2682486 RepID=UPI0012E2A480|nr:hypothetical protein [Paenibacillus sp. NEAU-GSW1]MUT67150.1 hypothetical protein [Paenibacillus sp. NEAU-GSW1]